MTTDHPSLAILEGDREPYNLITYHGVEAYRRDGLSISPHYEVVDQTAEGIDIYQCRMVIENRARTCLLVEVWKNDPVAYRVLLTGQAEVEAHRARYFS